MHAQTGRRAGWCQGLDGADKGAASEYDEVGEFGVTTAHWRVHYGSVVTAGFFCFQWTASSGQRTVDLFRTPGATKPAVQIPAAGEFPAAIGGA